MKKTLRVARSAAILLAFFATTAFGTAEGYEVDLNHYILCAGLCATNLPSPVVLGQNAWTPIGRDGADISAFAVDPVTPSTVYAGALRAGVLKSTDAGATWATANKGLPTVNVSALAIDSTTPSTLYAVTSAGVYKSTDGAADWIASSQGLPAAANVPVNTLTISRTSPATLYAGTSVGLFRTTDGAATWEALGGSAPAGGAFDESGGSDDGVLPGDGFFGTGIFIAVDPTRASTLYVGVTCDGVYKSDDAGTTWAKVFTSSGPQCGLGGTVFNALLIDPRAPDHLYLASSGGVFTSTDGGRNWGAASLTPGAASLTPYVLALAMDSSSSTTIFALDRSGQVYRSTDAGIDWTAVGGETIGGEDAATSMAAAATVPPSIYVGRHDGIVQSVDAAQTWSRLTLGVRAIPAFGLAVDPVAPSTIYAGTSIWYGSPGVDKTTDGGAHWSTSYVGASDVLPVLAIDPTSPSIVYAGGRVDNSGTVFYKSTDAGAHWVPGGSDSYEKYYLTAIAIAPSRPSTLYVIETNEDVLDNNGVPSEFNGIYRSVDGGASLVAGGYGFEYGDVQNELYLTAMAVDPVTADTVYVATIGPYPTSTARIYKSTDGAVNFRQVAAALPAYAQINVLAVDPITPANVYAGYTVEGAGGPAVIAGDVEWSDAYKEGIGGMLKSSDGGETWADIHLSPSASVTAIAIDPSTPSNIYAATASTVIRSTDGAQTWTAMNAGLPSSWISGLAIDATGTLLRAATAAGLYEYRITNAEETPGGGYQGLWWVPLGAESGWGLNLAHQGNQIYGTWFTYDTNGKPLWLSVLANFTVPPIGYLFYWSGTIYANSGPPFDNYSGNSVATPVGNGRLDFSNANTANFSYTVNGVSQFKTITRYDLASGPQPTCTYSDAPDLNAATNYTDLWWAAGGAEPGWGVNLAHQGNSIFATWYTYGTDNAPLWLSVLAQRVGAGNAYTGTLYRSSGPRFDAYDSSKVMSQQVGTATLTFADGNHASFAYATNGAGGLAVITQTKQITRFLFAAPAGTVCQ